MGGEMNPAPERDEATAAWEPPTDSHVEPGYEDGDVDLPEMPSGGPTGPVTRRNLVFGALFITAALVGLYFLVPKLTGLNQTWGRLKRGDPLWLAVGAGFELLSIAGYAVLFRTVFARGVSRLSWRATIEIPLAGIAAIRLLAAAGAGGVAVTVWALRRAGMAPRVIACRIAANYSIQYSLYLLAIVVSAGSGCGAAPSRAADRRLSPCSRRSSARWRSRWGRRWGCSRTSPSGDSSASRGAAGGSAGWRRGSRRCRRRWAPAFAPRSG